MHRRLVFENDFVFEHNHYDAFAGKWVTLGQGSEIYFLNHGTALLIDSKGKVRNIFTYNFIILYIYIFIYLYIFK